MSYTTKRNIISIIAGLGLIAVYIIYAMRTSAPATEDIKAWSVAILVFIGIGIGIQIVVQILFHIAMTIGIAIKEEVNTGNKNGDKIAERILKSEMQEDEMSKIIQLKASRAGSLLVGLGVIALLIALAFGVDMVVALHLLFGAFALASVVEGIASIVLHERGVR